MNYNFCFINKYWFNSQKLEKYTELYTYSIYNSFIHIICIYVFENLYDDHIGRIDLKTYDKMFWWYHNTNRFIFMV